VRVDLHLRTSAGSADSAIKVAALGHQARTAGLDALAITEHFRTWEPFEAERVEAESGIELLRRGGVRAWA